MRIPLHLADKWRGEKVLVKKLFSTKWVSAYLMSVPASYVGYSASFLHWIEYEDENHSCEVTEIYLVGSDEIRFIDNEEE